LKCPRSAPLVDLEHTSQKSLLAGELVSTGLEQELERDLKKSGSSMLLPSVGKITRPPQAAKVSRRKRSRMGSPATARIVAGSY